MGCRRWASIPTDRATEATTLGISEVAVKVTLHRLRARFRTLLREEVARTLDDGDDVDVEIQNLLARL